MVMATSIKDMELVVITTDTKLEDIKLVVAYAYGASWWRFQKYKGLALVVMDTNINDI